MKTGLVLEGGGMRGIYTAGVLDVFLRNNISFDGVVGTSAGAVHGCSFLSSQKGRSLRYYLKYCDEPRFMSFKSWIKTGNIVETEFAYHELPEKLDLYDYDAFNACETPFYAVCTNIESGLAELIKIEDMKEEIDAIRASASLPYFSQIVEFGGKKYLDGGIADAIAIKPFQEMGYEKNVVVLTRPDGYIKAPEKMIFAKLVYRKYPNLVKTMAIRHNLYNQTISYLKEQEKLGKVFIIRPSAPLAARRVEHSADNIQATYNAGAIDASNSLSALLDWLKK